VLTYALSYLTTWARQQAGTSSQRFGALEVSYRFVMGQRMRKKLISSVILVVLLCAIASELASRQSFAQNAPRHDTSLQNHLAIIVNRSNPIDNIPYMELQKVFLGERNRWTNGRRVTTVMRERGSPEREFVLNALYGMAEQDFERHWLRVQFSGEVQSPPKILSSAEGMKRFVFNVSGAIGYLRADELDDSVKVIRVDGHAPGEASYRFRLQMR
jgi:Ni/Co efflux regulator RcnB